MGSILARSETQKKRICDLTATGMYSARVVSISFSVVSAAATFSLISPDFTLDASRTAISSRSSTGLPSLGQNIQKRSILIVVLLIHNPIY